MSGKSLFAFVCVCRQIVTCMQTLETCAYKLSHNRPFNNRNIADLPQYTTKLQQNNMTNTNNSSPNSKVSGTAISCLTTSNPSHPVSASTLPVQFIPSIFTIGNGRSRFTIMPISFFKGLTRPSLTVEHLSPAKGLGLRQARTRHNANHPSSARTLARRMRRPRLHSRHEEQGDMAS
jgi:hypothetical protein